MVLALLVMAVTGLSFVVVVVMVLALLLASVCCYVGSCGVCFGVGSGVFCCVGVGVSFVGLHALVAGFHAVGFLLLVAMVLALYVLADIVCFVLRFVF